MPGPIALKLRNLREERGLTHKEAAELANVLVTSDRNHTMAVLVNGSDSYTLLGTLPATLRNLRKPPPKTAPSGLFFREGEAADLAPPSPTLILTKQAVSPVEYDHSRLGGAAVA